MATVGIHRWRMLVLVMTVCVFAWQCAVNPVTGKRELMLMTEADEIALGKQADTEIIAMYGAYQDADLLNYISVIGKKMTPITHRPHLPYSFKILDTPVVNAFAVPGGYVYFTRGILACLNDEAELAGVMGHELGHINARHSAKQYSRAQLVNLGLGLGSALSEDFAKYAGYAQVGIGLLFLRFSRDNEREADDLGVEYSTKSGYNSFHMANFFRTLERMHPSRGGILNDWFSTHPNPEDRIGAIERKTREWQQKYPGKSLAVNREAFLRAIDGLVYGEDPRQGYVEDGVFYHPTLDFQFPVPRGWKLANLPSQVQMQTEEQDAVMLFSIANASSLEGASEKFLRETGATPIATGRVQVSGLPALRLESQLVSRQNVLHILSYFIAKDPYIYAFHGYTTNSLYGSYRGTFVETMTGFGPVRDRSKLNVRPTRIAVRPAPSTGSLRSVLKSLGVEDDRLQELSLINGMRLDQQVQKGTLVKILVSG